MTALRCLHAVVRATEALDTTERAMMREVAAILPGGWQYPEIATACVEQGSERVASDGFVETAWMQTAVARAADGTEARVTVAYREARPAADEGPFLREERELIEIVAARLASVRDRLFSAVASRSDEGAIEAELASAKAAAKAANEAKDAFLRNMSHEFRTPMNAIVGFAHLVGREPLSVRQREQLARVTEAASDLLQILDDLLDFSKLVVGDLALEDLSFRVDEVFEAIASRSGEKAAASGLALVFDVAGFPAQLRGDGPRLRQVLEHFVSNALKFTPRGTVTVRARTVGADGEADLARFEVEDTGIGIAPEDRARIFQAFEQGDGSATREYGGTGLGLAISRRLVAQMGGTLGVESEVARGSTFWIEIPLRRAEPGAGLADLDARPRGPHVAKASRGDAERALAAARGAAVLLAEDDPVSREVAVELLRGVGIEVDCAVNGREAVELARSLRYDLILMDVQMPEIDGIDATRAIRALPGMGAVPIVAMTADASTDDRARCFAAGMDDHLGKPVDPDRLFGAIVRWLGERPHDPTTLEAQRGDGASSASSDLLDRIFAVPGIDAEEGLDRLGGDPSVYARVLRVFVERHGGEGARLRDLAERGDLAAIATTAHSLKGAAGNVSATRLAALVKTLEAAARSGATDEARAAVAAVIAELDLAIPAMRAAVQDTQAPPPPPVDWPRSSSVAQRLHALLAMDDTAAIDLFTDGRSALAPVLGDATAVIAARLEDFDFPGALAALDAAIAAEPRLAATP